MQEIVVVAAVVLEVVVCFAVLAREGTVPAAATHASVRRFAGATPLPPSLELLSAPLPTPVLTTQAALTTHDIVTISFLLYLLAS